MSDLLFQNLSTVQSISQPAPVTLASATTVAPTTYLTFISGTVAIATITPFVTGAHMLCFVFTTTTPTAYATTGNVKTTTAPVQNVPNFLVYDPTSAFYYQK